MVYNQTALEQSTTIFDLMTYSDTATGGVFFIIFLVSIFFIIIMSLRRYGFENALLVSSFFTFILSAVMASVGVVSVYMALIFGILTAGTYFYSTTVSS